MEPVAEKKTHHLGINLGESGQITLSVKLFNEMLLLKSTLEGTNLRERFFELLKKNEKEQLLLIIDYIKDVNIMTRNGETPLYYAVYNDDIELADLLIKKGADVNVGKDDETPLHHVARYGQVELVKLLIDCGAELEILDHCGFTPLLSTVKLGQENKNAALILKTLLEAGADAKGSDSYGDTALHGIKRKDLCRILIDHGADVNARNNKGLTPLHGAPYEVARCLVKYGKAKVDPVDNNGDTPLGYARSRTYTRDRRLIRFLKSPNTKTRKMAK